MVEAVDAQSGGVFVRKCPADIIMAAHVVDPGRARGECMPFPQGLGQQVDFAGGQGVPKQGHEQRVVRKLAFLRIDIGDDVVGMDDGLGEEEEARRGDASHRVEGADEGVGVG